MVAERDRLAQAGIKIIRWGTAVGTGNEQLGVLQLTNEKRATLFETFGPWLDLYNLDDYGTMFSG